MEAMQLPTPGPGLDRSARQSGIQQLRQRDDTVLPLGANRHLLIT
jgi:hypothetical protein